MAKRIAQFSKPATIMQQCISGSKNKKRESFLLPVCSIPGMLSILYMEWQDCHHVSWVGRCKRFVFSKKMYRIPRRNEQSPDSRKDTP